MNPMTVVALLSLITKIEPVVAEAVALLKGGIPQADVADFAGKVEGLVGQIAEAISTHKANAAPPASSAGN